MEQLEQREKGGVAAWAQLCLHAKPIVLLNDTGYYEPLLTLIHHAVAKGFIPKRNTDLLHYEQSPAEALRRMADSQPLAALVERVEPPAEQ